MSAIKQWLVDPASAETPCYITNNPAVAQKRADKGDYVVEIERTCGWDDTQKHHLPIHAKVHPTKPVVSVEQRYGNTDAHLKKLAEKDDEL